MNSPVSISIHVMATHRGGRPPVGESSGALPAIQVHSQAEALTAVEVLVDFPPEADTPALIAWKERIITLLRLIRRLVELAHLHACGRELCSGSDVMTSARALEVAVTTKGPSQVSSDMPITGTHERSRKRECSWAQAGPSRASAPTGPSACACY